MKREATVLTICSIVMFVGAIVWFLTLRSLPVLRLVYSAGTLAVSVGCAVRAWRAAYITLPIDGP